MGEDIPEYVSPYQYVINRITLSGNNHISLRTCALALTLNYQRGVIKVVFSKPAAQEIGGNRSSSRIVFVFLAAQDCLNWIFLTGQMATIKLYELFVLTVALLSEASHVTSAYYSARSWGDPHITTIDNVEYDFNGHGEYIFLHTGNTTVQVRTEYMNPGNKDSTIFVAVAIKDDFGQFEAQLINRTSGVVTVYKDGVVACSSNDSLPQGTPSIPCGFSSTPPRPVRGVIVGNGKVLFWLKGFGSYLKTLTLQGGSDISITLDGIKDSISHSNLTGLAGGSVNIKAQNGILFNVSKRLDMFKFGESLRITENESLFNYSLSSGNYSTYNTFSRPTFYEDYLTNLTSLFNLDGHQHNDSDIDEFDKTCNESKVRDECLLAIARSDDIAAGEAVNTNYRHEQYVYNRRHNFPPYFTDEITDLDVYLADNHSVILNLSNYVHDNNTGDILTFLVETNLPKTHFMLDSVSGIFNWTVLPSLRDLNDSIKITFTVHDRFNSIVFKDVKVNFCGCNKTSQCDNQHFDKCICQDDKYVTGDYCEIHLDPCNVTTCFNQSMCNGDNIRDDTGPCAPCPKGRYSDFQSDQQICHDEDECDSKYDGGDKCDVNSNCTNTDGSFTCTCHHGYRLMSNGYQCEDKDECNEGVTCKENEVCRNTPGNFMCDCVKGYGRKDGGPCVKMGMRVEDAVTVRCNDFGWDVRVNMNTLRQQLTGAKASDIYMGDNSCTGQETWNGYLHFNQGLKECITYESIRYGESVYSNQLIYAEHDPTRPYIIRHFNWTISLECTMNKNKTTSGHLHNDHLPLDGSIHSVQGADQNDLNMTFYRDPQFSHQIEGNPLQVSVGDDIYVKVFTMTSQKIRVHTCYTKPSIDSLAPLRYMLITNGCEVDPSTHILSQTIHETRFVFTEFEFTTNHEGLFVFCDVTFCNINDSSDQCSQKCVR